MPAPLEIHIPYLLPGLNGKDGLIRQHFREAARAKEKLFLCARAQRPAAWVPVEKCRVVYTRWAARRMDWDNAAASAKHLLDALVKAGIMRDDSPEVVVEFSVRQEKSKKLDECTTIEIIPVV